jgi:hypothetical protein
MASVQVKVRRKRRDTNGQEIEKVAPRRVNFFSFEQDFQCPLLAAIGLSTAAIAQITQLTEGQVMYRIMKFEDARRRVRDGKKEPTSRTKYRMGAGEMAQAMISSVTGTRSPVKGLLIQEMEKKDLYTPRLKGVMKDKR